MISKDSMTIRTRFAPSPTGLLHIGNARAALFNFLFTRHHDGKFLLRIEDTDRERSTQEAIDVIFAGLDWMGITPDEEPIFQSSREARHREVALDLLKKGLAYKCFCTPEELKEMRDILEPIIDRINDPDERAIMRLRYLKGYGTESISNAIYKTERAVYYVLSRVEKRLAKMYPDLIVS